MTEQTTGYIYLKLPNDNLQYHILINNFNYFTVYPEKFKVKLKQQNMYKESLAQPQWVDKKTLVFKIPFGEWDISYSYTASTPHLDTTGGWESANCSASIHVNINKEHNIVKIETKKKFFSNYLVEV